jgi:heavy metal efflux system protein
VIDKLVDFVTHERLIVIVLSLLLLGSSIYTFGHLNVEVYPDPSPPLIQVITQNPNWSAEEIERQLTVPLENELKGMPDMKNIRSISVFGLSTIYCYFNYGSEYFRDRQEVLNRMQAVTLPPGNQAEISPESPVGEIYRFQLVGERHTLMELKEAMDWIVVKKFKEIPGVVDVVSFGGPTKEYHVDLDPKKLLAFHLSVTQVMNALTNSNSNVGASYLELGGQSCNVRGIGLFKTTQDIESVMVAEKNGVPVYIRQLGEVRIGRKIPLGRVGRDDDPDIVEGMVLLRPGEKSLPVLKRIPPMITRLNSTILPKSMKIVTFYDRTDLISVTTHTVIHNLIGGIILVVFILFIFIGDVRASLVVAFTIPLTLAFTFLVMAARGESANLISMGAIDFGIIVEASIVMVENIYRHYTGMKISIENVRLVTFSAAKEVAVPIIFSTVILLVAFAPLFTMQGVEGKIFRPMAMTYGFALLGALLLSFTFSIVAASLFLRPRAHCQPFLMCLIARVYSWVLKGVLKMPALTVALSLVAVIGTAALIPSLGGEFMPKLEEGGLWVHGTLPTKITFRYACELTDQIRAIIKSYPEVKTVVSQLGRPDDGTDPTSFFNIEFFVCLKDRKEWPQGLTKNKLVEEMDTSLRQIPGVGFSFSQPIEDMVEEGMSGVKGGENAIKIVGGDLKTLNGLANRVLKVMEGVPGIKDMGILRELGQPNLIIRPDRNALARYGLQVGDVNGLIQTAVGGQAATQVLDGDRRFDLVVRFLPDYRMSIDAIGAIPVSTADGGFVPLRQVAEISQEVGASFVYRDNNERFIPIRFSVRGRDMVSTIDELGRKINGAIKMPEGYYFEWAGEFQEFNEANRRLMIMIPVSLVLIALLLYIAFRRISGVLLILGTVPLALIGGVLALYITKTNFSISAAVGFISLFGVSVLGGIILVSRINQLRAEGVPLEEAIHTGSELQLRPVLMVAMAAAFGLLPAAIATRIGSEIQQPLARVIVGGMITSPILTLIVIPALYRLVYRKHAQPQQIEQGSEEGR